MNSTRPSRLALAAAAALAVAPTACAAPAAPSSAPSGAPGMNGEKAGPLTVYSLTDGVADKFATS